MIEKYLDSVTEEIKRATSTPDKLYVNEEKLLFVYAYYHYFNADSSKLIDIKDGLTYDGNFSDHIDGVYIDQDSDQQDIDIILSLYRDAEFDIPTVFGYFRKAEEAIFGTKDIRKNLKNVIIECDDKYLECERPVKIRIITNFTPKTSSLRFSINNALKNYTPMHNHVSYHIHFGSDIEYEILEIEDPKEFVDYAELEIDAENNSVLYGEEKSAILNISAKSLKRVYELYSCRGLFAQNLRYYVKNAKVDDGIIKSIQEKPDNFWYYNNGMIIICDNYILTGRHLKLWNFSIINGGQTTKIIGDTEFEIDFHIQCKIVKNKYQDNEERVSFVAEVAEASNTQKPIKAKDLIANRIEQRMLKKQLADARIFCQIKRGEKVNKKLYPESWQNTTNEELAQFIYSFMYQKPGSARGNKSSLTGNKEKYDLIFKKKYSSAMLADILRLKTIYKEWLTKLKKGNHQSDAYKEGLCKNGQLYFYAIFGTIYKFFLHGTYFDKINELFVIDERMEIISQFDVDHQIFIDTENRKQQILNLFEYCYDHFMLQGYELLKSFKPQYNSYSNFTKLDSNYRNYVLKELFHEIKDGFDSRLNVILSSTFYVPTAMELSHDNEILTKYINTMAVAATFTNLNISEDQTHKIALALSEYRIKKSKANKVSLFEVFTNTAKEKISKNAPKSFIELEVLKCLSPQQLRVFGQEIVEIVAQSFE